MRDDVSQVVSDEQLLNALASVRVAFVSDSANLASPEGQHALVSTVMLCARSGAHCHLELPDVPIRGTCAPLRRERLLEGLMDLGSDLLPGLEFTVGAGAVDLAVIIGDSPWRGRATQIVRLSGNAWKGMTGPTGERWASTGSPFGALAAGGLATVEAFKIAMRRLARLARDAEMFQRYFAPVGSAQVVMAPDQTPPPNSSLPDLDIVSGGAITHSALFALTRIPDVVGRVRVIEPKQSDLPDLNRYALLRRSRIGLWKADDLATQKLGNLRITGIRIPFANPIPASIGALASAILVGVDHIPSRWAVQQARPSWIGIGATSHYGAMASYHTRGLPCAICLHQRDDEDDRPAPTCAWVSYWAGLWLAAMFIREVNASPFARNQQQIFASMLQSDSPHAIWQSPVVSRPNCPVGCPL